MAFSVRITAAALRDAEEYCTFILEQSNDHIPADTWFNGLLQAIYSLNNLPARCPAIPEQDRFEEPLHQLLYASHRIIFSMKGNTVEILRIYHTSMRPLRSLRQRPHPRKPA